MGRIWKFGANVDTDQIIASRYLLRPSVAEMVPHAFEGLRPEMAAQFSPGDLIVGGKNFGCGSSREQAPRVLKELGAAAIIAESFARIFYRNCLNIGLPVIICPEFAEAARDREHAELDLEAGEISYGGATLFHVYEFPRYPEHVLGIVRSGGLLEHILAQKG